MLATSRNFVDGNDAAHWYRRGPFVYRVARHPWPDGCCPITTLDYRDGPADDVTYSLVARGSETAADIWVGLRQGYLLAARRQQVLDELILGGVQLHITSASTPDAHEFRPDLPNGLGEALLRRVRFLCRGVERSSLHDRRLRVVDLGWDTRR